ncbi:nucleotidyltransferase domain-containing protein [Amycolatopsis roodepoortensis]|uniref:Polymerase nucleotidyl transferase domain-containing protein n=1 Tax=Amycolatopsis roodepoortensis TaxID=700274 RepID=A0ABR9L982_9PSEU|nr:nucleotidyltransferase domain-containing protein [Amycolatopsis roodepoortensis]MBE1577248.1 hypothetical protein [Amycolatopsis roodepoortensis]
MDAVRIAREVVETRFPAARAAILGGSANTGRRTASSDLDVVVFLDGPPAPYRETTELDGVPVELFCHTAESYEGFADRETADRRSPLLHMCGEGVVLLDRDGFGRRTRADAGRACAPGLRRCPRQTWRTAVTCSPISWTISTGPAIPMSWSSSPIGC